MGRTLRIASGKTLTATPVFDSYWRFAAARQALFMRRIQGDPPPWTSDKIIAAHRFTNTYRAADRVSQYLIRHVIYTGLPNAEEVFFRTILFKLFNRIDTWELLVDRLGETPNWRGFNVERYARILDAAYASGKRLYSAAYIMPSPPFGNERKHRNHLQLLDCMMRDGAPGKVGRALSLEEVFKALREYPSLGDFLAFQFAIDLNYSEFVDFPEADFVVAGPGARDGIAKCFSNTSSLTEAEIIAHVAMIADEEFDRLGLQFHKLGGKRPLQLIDCQNLFCEVDKYARVAHPEFSGESGRTRIKQKFSANYAALPQFYPPKWELNDSVAAARTSFSTGVSRASQISLSFVHPAD
ncbi:nucleotide kinase domain-containing protein [Corallococcus exiguus]|uniref:nucleotide kinase domain-containing protein n=1 Tax=Corallococcus exiguus TaxID=83462 RepID=UPI003DA20E2F